MPRILVVAPNWIGDALMAQPLLSRLREKLPSARIDALAPAWVAPVLRRMAEVEEVLDSPFRHGELHLRRRWKFARALRERRYDQAIVLPNSWKSALVPFFSDIPLRSGYVGESRYGLLNLLYRPPANAARTPMTEHFARLADAPPGGSVPALRAPRLEIDASIARATAQRFGFAPPPARNAVLCPGAEYGPAKRWPAEHFAQLAAALAALGVRVWLLGSAADRALAGDIVAGSGGAAASLAGRTTLDEAIELIAAGDFLVTNDSGLMHVAAALDRPLVALFGSSSPEHTPPLSPRARVARVAIDCSPCYARACPLGHFRCMRELGVARVLSELEQLGVLNTAQRAAAP
ncbi:MAG: lipopolysaccharide heptosyltransferase II [Betaproteobacteria bacterium]|nr:lipopolysaccharide heptosyltransferase II [Betaproteobacteria bacterium]